MARVTETVQPIVRAGLNPTYYTVGTGGSAFPNTGREVLHVKNAGAGSINVTVQTPGTVDDLAVADLVVAVGTSTNGKFIGPFPTGIYNQADGAAYVDYSSVTSVTIAVLRV